MPAYSRCWAELKTHSVQIQRTRTANVERTRRGLGGRSKGIFRPVDERWMPQGAGPGRTRRASSLTYTGRPTDMPPMPQEVADMSAEKLQTWEALDSLTRPVQTARPEIEDFVSVGELAEELGIQWDHVLGWPRQGRRGSGRPSSCRSPGLPPPGRRAQGPWDLGTVRGLRARRRGGRGRLLRSGSITSRPRTPGTTPRPRPSISGSCANRSRPQGHPGARPAGLPGMVPRRAGEGRGGTTGPPGGHAASRVL